MSGGYSFGFARIYDILNTGVDYSEIADTAAGIFVDRGISGGLLLDLACGTGTLSCQLASRGFEVIGTDASPDMLAVACGKNAGLVSPVMYLCQSMEKLDLYGTVSAAVCTMDSLNHLPSPAALGRVLDRLRLFIEPGGLFVFDMNTPYKHREVLGCNTFVRESENVFCVWQNSYRTANNSVDISIDCFEKRRDGAYLRSSDSFSEFALEDDDVASILTAHGFSLLDALPGYSFDRDANGIQRLIFTARRN